MVTERVSGRGRDRGLLGPAPHARAAGAGSLGVWPGEGRVAVSRQEGRLTHWSAVFCPQGQIMSRYRGYEVIKCFFQNPGPRLPIPF